MRGTTLYVSGFERGLTARELAYDFERFGPLVRCDIPPPKYPTARSFAFVEFEDPRDASDAYHEMHQQRTRTGDIISVEWARAPRTSFPRGPPPPRPSSRPRYDRDRDRSLSPYRRRVSPPSPRRYSERDFSRDTRARVRSRSPPYRSGSHSRYVSPSRRLDDEERRGRPEPSGIGGGGDWIDGVNSSGIRTYSRERYLHENHRDRQTPPLSPQTANRAR